jgi:hypothetical protein
METGPSLFIDSGFPNRIDLSLLELVSSIQIRVARGKHAMQRHR